MKLASGQLAPATQPVNHNQWGFTDNFLNDLVPEGISGTGGMVVDTNQFGFSDSFLNELVPANTSTGFDSNFWFGNAKTGTNGAALPTLNLVNGLTQGFLGFEQLGIARDKLNENKRQFNLNFGNQARLTNSRLRDRQERRIAEGRASGTVEDYMAQNGMRTA